MPSKARLKEEFCTGKKNMFNDSTLQNLRVCLVNFQDDRMLALIFGTGDWSEA